MRRLALLGGAAIVVAAAPPGNKRAGTAVAGSSPVKGESGAGAGAGADWETPKSRRAPRSDFERFSKYSPSSISVGVVVRTIPLLSISKSLWTSVGLAVVAAAALGAGSALVVSA